MRSLAILLPLTLAACVSTHGADVQRDGSLTLTFIRGYSRSDAMRGPIHAALRAQPDGETVGLPCAFIDDTWPGKWLYLTHFPGVHNAADAEAFEAAVREAHHLLGKVVGQRSWSLADTREAADALARFLAPEPPR